MVTDSRTKVLVAGGGVAGLEAILALRAIAPGRFDIELVTPQRHITSRSLSTGPPFLRATANRAELATITAEHGVRLTRDALELIEPDLHEILTQGGARCSYDVLVLALGTRPTRSVQGAMAFRGLQDLIAVTGALDAVTSVAYVASSTSMWAAPLYEVAAQTAAWATHRGKALHVLVITAERVGESLSARLADAGVEVVDEAVVDRFSGGLLELADGRRVEVGLAVALPRLICPIVRGMPSRSRDGFTVVDESGQVAGMADVYAVGDMTGRRVLAAEQAGAAAGAIATN